MPVYQREVDREILRETNERVVHGGIAVRVKFTHTVAYDTGALSERLIVVQPHFVHRVQNSSVNGLQAVAYVGNGTRFIHRHSVCDERTFQFVVHFHIEYFRHFESLFKLFG